MKRSREFNNLLAGFAEDLDASQMMMDAANADAKGYAEASVERLKALIPTATAKLACELGRMVCEVSVDGDTYLIKARRL